MTEPETKDEDRRPAGLERGIARLERQRESKEEKRAAGDLRGQRARGWTEKLLTRTTSGAIYSILITACLFCGPIATCVIVTAMAWLCCSEFFRMARMSGRMPNEFLGLAIAIAYPVAALLPIDNGLVVVTFALLVGCAIWYVATPRANIADVAVTAFGPLYTSLLFSCVVLIRASDPSHVGGLLTFGCMGSIWMSDATAYLVGSRFGRHKLAPKISPNKSVEGFWGGLVGCVAIWVVMWALPFWHISLPFALVSGLVVGIVSVVGDLFESRIKRGVGVKDSGDIMPGHGGLLDRSDSQLFGCMVAYLILHVGGIV
ncbi:MAG: phosphatidate cytidylyltransferase [Olsenella sp.]|nr:phosphatidate cytidylyltransferase [Olsenella sp.]